MMNISPIRQILIQQECDKVLFPYGKSRSRNVLADFTYRPSAKKIKILFLNCEDLHRALQTTATHSRPSYELHYVINNTLFLNIARSVLILKIITQNFDPTKKEDLDYVWSVWYDVYWKSRTISLRLKKDLQDLINCHLPENIEILPPKYLLILVSVWKVWYSAILDSDHKFVSKVLSERLDHIQDYKRGWCAGMEKEIEEQEKIHFLADKVSKHMGVQDFPETLKRNITLEACKFLFELEEGIDEKERNYINPTLLQLNSRKWMVNHRVCPFNGYLPLPINELNPDDEDCAKHYCQNVLKGYLLSFREKKDNIRWIFHFGNPLELCYSISEKFDVIDCSDLADDVGLANLIVAAGLRLSEEVESVLLLETSNWISSATTIVEFVEDNLCAPLPVLPSLYGMRLVHPTQFGASTPPDSNTVFLTWKRTPPYTNLRPNFLPSFLPWLSKLALKCFNSDTTANSVASFGLTCFTPITFFYILTSAAQRMDRGYDALKQCEILLKKLGKPFELAWRTLYRWTWISMLPRIGIPHLDKETMDRVIQHISQCPDVKLLFINVPFDRIELDYFCAAQKKSPFLATPMLRVILLPHDSYQNLESDKPLDISSCNNVHCIDNILLDFKKTRDNSCGWCKVSFPIISDHELKDTHSAVLVDAQTGLPIIFMGPVSKIQEEHFTQPHPFSHPGSSLPSELSELVESTKMESNLSVLNCLETEFGYIITVSCRRTLNEDMHEEDSAVDVPGLTWITDCQSPCESANSITLTLNQPTGSTTSLTFAVPFPFLEETVKAVQRNPDQIQLHLQKAIFEPWPTQFTSRWEYAADNLRYFKFVGEHHLMELSVHLERQFESHKVPNTPANLSLFHIRLAICRIFEFVVKKEHEFFMIAESSSDVVDVAGTAAPEPDWYVRVRLPIRSDSHGNPILVLSVFDCNLAPKIVLRGTSNDQIETDFKRIFSNEANSDTKHIPLITFPSLRESQLFRALLRFNSTKILPSQFQEENLPLGKNSPWLATFLSPCFSQYPRSSSEIWENFLIKKRRFQKETVNDVGEKNCGGCE